MRAVSSWAERLLGFAVSVLIAAWLLSWAWSLLRPLVPVLLVFGVLCIALRLLLLRRQRW